MRLDKFLSDMGCGTRSELKKVIRKGLVKVGGQTVKDPGFQVGEDADVVLDGMPVCYQRFVYMMMNKPQDVITSTSDSRDVTVKDLLEMDRYAGTDTEEEAAAAASRRDIAPVGRLDKDTEGLILLTNDGDLSHRLLSPKRHVDKVYYAVLERPADESDAGAFAAGLEITDEDPFTAMPAELKLMEDRKEVFLTIREGKYHQVKRMFAQRGNTVLFLRRVSMGPLELDETLEPGQWRLLTAEETEALREI